ncbi:MAG: beta-galactosidase small subunit, partial [Pseudomonadota bacterium]
LDRVSNEIHRTEFQGLSVVTRGRVRFVEDEQRIIINGRKTRVVFDKTTGYLSSFQFNDREYLKKPIKPNFWRAPTDNDFGNYMGEWAAPWREASSNQTLTSITVRQEGRAVEVEADYSVHDGDGNTVGNWLAKFAVQPNGRVDVDNRFTKGKEAPIVPRVGLHTELNRSFDQVEWYGRGPHENYEDRKVSADVGRYQNRVVDHYVPYLRPQENGYKTDTQWLSLGSPDGMGLLVLSPGKFSFGVSHHRLNDLVPPMKVSITREDGPERYNTKRVNVHVNDVKDRDLVTVNIDYGQMGVGGDDSWGKRTLQKYSLNQSSYGYQFSLLPYEDESQKSKWIERASDDGN